MSKLITFFSRLKGMFNSAKAKDLFERAEMGAIAAAPFIEMAGEFVVTLTPTKVDDAALAYLKQEFPHFFDGSVKTPAELNIYLLGIASKLFNRNFPTLSNTEAVLAIQAAYGAKKAG